MCMLNIRSKDLGQISARSWWPASEREWKTAKPYSYWNSTIVGLTSGSWSSFPNAGVEALSPSQLELGNTEVLINSPSFISHPATINRHLMAEGPPPPPPAQPESSWGAGYGANYGSSTCAPAPTGSHHGNPPRASLAEGPPVDILGDYDSPDDEWKSSNASHGTFYENICGEFYPTGEKSCAQT